MLGRDELSSLNQHRLQMARQVAWKIMNSGEGGLGRGGEGGGRGRGRGRGRDGEERGTTSPNWGGAGER